MNKLSVITTPRSFENKTHLSLINLGLSPLSIEQISRFGISVQWVSKKQLDLWLEYEGLSEEKKRKAKKKYPTAGVETLQTQDFSGLEALVILNRTLTQGLWDRREYNEFGDYQDHYADPWDLDLPLLIKGDQPYEYSLGDLTNADLLNRMVETYYGVSNNPEKSDKGFKFVVVMRPEVTDKLIFGKWVWSEVKLSKVKPGCKIQGGKLENMVTLDADLPKANVKDIDQYSLSMIPVGLSTIFGEWEPKPSVPDTSIEYGSVVFDPPEKQNYDHFFKETGKPARPTQSQLTQGKNYSSGVIKVKQKNASPDHTVGEKPLTRKYTDPKTGVSYNLDIVGKTIFLNPDNGSSIPVAKIAISVEPNILGQPVIVLQTIRFKSSCTLDLNRILGQIQELLLGKYKILGENRDRIEGEQWSISRFLDRAYHNLGYRLNSEGLWIDWIHNRDIQLWSRYADEEVYCDDGRSYEDGSTFITPTQNSYQIAKEVETRLQLQRVAVTRQKQVDAARQNNDEVLQRDLIADLGYDLSGLTSKQLKNLKRKLKREGKIPTGEYKPEPGKPTQHKLY